MHNSLHFEWSMSSVLLLVYAGSNLIFLPFPGLSASDSGKGWSLAGTDYCGVLRLSSPCHTWGCLHLTNRGVMERPLSDTASALLWRTLFSGHESWYPQNLT